MKCPRCGNSETRVSDTRYTNGGLTKRRRRQCTECGKKFTTYEDYDNKDNHYNRGWNDALERVIDFIKEKFEEEEIPIIKK